MDSQYQKLNQKLRHDTETEYIPKTQQNTKYAPTYILYTDTEPYTYKIHQRKNQHA